MITVWEKLKEAKRLLAVSETEAQAEEGLEILRSLPAPPAITEDNEALARAYAYKLTLKKLSIAFFGTLGAEERDALVRYISRRLPELAEKFPGTHRAFEEVFSSVNSLSRAAESAESVRRALASDDADACREAAAGARAVLGDIDSCGLPARPLGEDVAFPDAAELAKKTLGRLADDAEKRYRAARAADEEALLSSLVRPLPDGAYDYFPDMTREMRGMAGAIALCTPIESEAELFARSLAAREKRTFAVVRAEALAARGEEEIGSLFAALATRGTDCLVTGAAHAAGAGEALLKAAAAFGERGRTALLCDDCDTVYEEGRKVGAFSRLDLSVPFFRDVMSVLVSRGMASEEDGEEVKRIMPFAGFVGLNEAVAAFVAGRNWKKVAAERSDENAPAALAYLSRLGNPVRFIDSDWGDFSEYRRGADAAKRAFDYDEVRVVSPANVRRIMESGQSLYARIGALTRYCMLAGADRSAWSAMDRETREMRLKETTLLVYRALGMDTVPDVRIEDDLGKGVGGLCCDGGREIKYLERLTTDYEYMQNTVCHESYHAFQHAALAGGWRTWHFTELGVIEPRLEEWRFNFSHYYADTSSKGYKVEIVEGDARSFAAECVRRGNECWHLIELE